MHILINATSARLHGGGGTTVLKNLLPALLSADDGSASPVRGHRYTVVARHEVVAELDPLDPRVTFIGSPLERLGIAGRVLWEQLGVPLRAHLSRADVVFSPAGVAVLTLGIPQVLMHQNMVPFDPNVQGLYRGNRRARFIALRIASASTAWLARDVVFISEYARRVIGPSLPMLEHREHLVHLGRDASFTPKAIERAPEVLSQLGISAPYILSVSHFYQYKNLLELVQGFALALPRIDRRTTLVIAGAEHEVRYASAVRATIGELNLRERVRLVGNVPYASMPSLYAAAELFVFSSTCECFPQIPIEAMASGAPTIASNVQPMPEVVGAGADFFDPRDPEDIARAIVSVLEPGGAVARRAELRERGLHWVQRYSWEASGRKLLAVLDGAARTGW